MLSMSHDKMDPLAGIQYSGVAGSTKECQDAVLRLLQYGDRITLARILSHSNDHCLLLTVNNGDLVAIKSGFSSGYRGGGPHGFSYVLRLLDVHGADIDEYDVDEDVMERLDRSALTKTDLAMLDSARPIRPSRWPDYVFEEDVENGRSGRIWREFRPIIPFAVVDSRIFDLAISFWEDPDGKLMTGYRRLEDMVRERTGIDEVSAKLFSQAFLGEEPKLGWKALDKGARAGRGSLFTAAYTAHRSRRAHRELREYANDQLTEFMLLNHLYLLEKDSCEDWRGEPPQ
jgi:hypothetical protein